MNEWNRTTSDGVPAEEGGQQLEPCLWVHPLLNRQLAVNLTVSLAQTKRNLWIPGRGSVLAFTLLMFAL